MSFCRFFSLIFRLFSLCRENLSAGCVDVNLFRIYFTLI